MINQIVKATLYLCIFILPLNYSLAQKDVLMHFAVSEGVYLYKTALKNKATLFSKTNLELGTQFNFEKGQLNAFGVYQLFGNFKSEEIHGFISSSHLLGIGAEHRVNKNKNLSLIIGLSALTEFSSNFRNGYIDNGVPVYPSKEHSDDFYHSTPFASSLWIGLDMRLSEGLYLNFSIENNFRIIKSRHLNWDLSDFKERPIEEVINEQAIETVIYDKVGLRLGLSYNLPLERKN